MRMIEANKSILYTLHIPAPIQAQLYGYDPLLNKATKITIRRGDAKRIEIALRLAFKNKNLFAGVKKGFSKSLGINKVSFGEPTLYIEETIGWDMDLTFGLNRFMVSDKKLDKIRFDLFKDVLANFVKRSLPVIDPSKTSFKDEKGNWYCISGITQDVFSYEEAMANFENDMYARGVEI